MLPLVDSSVPRALGLSVYFFAYLNYGAVKKLVYYYYYDSYCHIRKVAAENYCQISAASVEFYIMV